MHKLGKPPKPTDQYYLMTFGSLVHFKLDSHAQNCSPGGNAHGDHLIIELNILFVAIRLIEMQSNGLVSIKTFLNDIQHKHFKNEQKSCCKSESRKTLYDQIQMRTHFSIIHCIIHCNS